MGGQTFSVDILVGELVKAQELNISDSDDDGSSFVSDFQCISVWAIVLSVSNCRISEIEHIHHKASTGKERICSDCRVIQTKTESDEEGGC